MKTSNNNKSKALCVGFVLSLIMALIGTLLMDLTALIATGAVLMVLGIVLMVLFILSLISIE